MLLLWLTNMLYYIFLKTEHLGVFWKIYTVQYLAKYKPHKNPKSPENKFLDNWTSSKLKEILKKETE